MLGVFCPPHEVQSVAEKDLARMSEKELLAHIDTRIRAFKGDLTQLERAIGALIAGRKFGWKVMLLVHDRKTIEKYEQILDVDFKTLPETAECTHKSIGWIAVQKVASFWKAVKGEYPGVKSVEVK
jgi:hypothetical protein